MATIAQLEEALRKAHEAGKFEDARAFASEIKRLRTQKLEEPEFEAGALDYARAAGQGVAFGFGDELAAIARSLGDETYEEAVAAERAALEKFRDKDAISAYGLEIAGSIPSSVLLAAPLGRVGLLAKGALAASKVAPLLRGTQAASKVAPILAKTQMPLKTAAIAGTEGAIYGAGAAEEGERLTGAQVGGGVGAVLGGTAASVLPRISQQAQKLIEEGVPLTAGQAMGGGVRVVEEALQAVPYVKDAVRKAKERVTEGFTSAAMNRALSPIRKEVTKDLSGTEAFDEALDIISKRYEEVIPNLNISSVEDMKFAVQASIREAVENQPTLVGRDLEDFNAIIGNVFSKLPQSGGIDGKILKEIESRLGSSARAKFRAGRADIGMALNDIKSAFRQELARQDTTGSKALAEVNEAYRNIIPIERSVGKAIADSGAFTPKQLLQSMRQASPRQAARGQMTDQDFAQMAQDIIGRKSGEGSLVAPLTGLTIAQQALLGNLAPAFALATGASLIAPAYSRLGVPITRGLLTKTGRAIEDLTPSTSGLLGGAVTSREQ